MHSQHLQGLHMFTRLQIQHGLLPVCGLSGCTCHAEMHAGQLIVHAKTCVNSAASARWPVSRGRLMCHSSCPQGLGIRVKVCMEAEGNMPAAL